jgi:hypothetical protein
MDEEHFDLDGMEKVFAADSDPLRGVWLKDGSTNLVIIIDAYYDAAAALVDLAIEKGRMGESYFFPICYLYRQYIELSLKHLVALGNRINSEETAELRTHNLTDLWKRCRPVIQMVFPHDDQSQVAALERLLNEFQRIDPSSTAFRYEDEAQKLHDVHNLNNISLANLAEVMRRVALLLNGCGAGFAEALSWKHDMETNL